MKNMWIDGSSDEQKELLLLREEKEAYLRKLESYAMVENEFWTLKKKFDEYGGDEGFKSKQREVEKLLAINKDLSK